MAKNRAAASMENIYTLVAKSDMPFSEIAQQSGHLSPSHLAAMFRKRFETTMTAARVKRLIDTALLIQ